MKIMSLDEAIQFLATMKASANGADIEVKVNRIQVEIKTPDIPVDLTALPEVKELFTIQESAAILGISEGTMRSYLSLGRVHALRLTPRKIKGVLLDSLLPHMKPAVRAFYQKQIGT